MELKLLSATFRLRLCSKIIHLIRSLHSKYHTHSLSMNTITSRYLFFIYTSVNPWWSISNSSSVHYHSKYSLQLGLQNYSIYRNPGSLVCTNTSKHSLIHYILCLLDRSLQATAATRAAPRPLPSSESMRSNCNENYTLSYFVSVAGSWLKLLDILLTEHRLYVHSLHKYNSTVVFTAIVLYRCELLPLTRISECNLYLFYY